MKLVQTIVKTGVMIGLAALFLPGLFTPWRDALYDLSEVESQRQLGSVAAKLKGGMPDTKCMIGDSVVITWIPRDFEKTAEEGERFFKAFVSFPRCTSQIKQRSLRTFVYDCAKMRIGWISALAANAKSPQMIVG